MSNITFSKMGRPNNFTMQFNNGYALSITKGHNAYSGTDSAEIAVLKDKEFVRIEGQRDDVIGWVSADVIASVAYWVARGDLDAVRDAIDGVLKRRLHDSSS
jgi:hypothetical protein